MIKKAIIPIVILKVKVVLPLVKGIVSADLSGLINLCHLIDPDEGSSRWTLKFIILLKNQSRILNYA